MDTTPEAIEELLELCWTAAEDGLVPLDREQLPTQLVCFLPHPIAADRQLPSATIERMIQQGLLEAEGRRIQLSAVGRTRAQAIVRRHRLTEVLLGNVLDVSEASLESTACQAEHILNAEVTDAVCAFLGHPPRCPHGRAIPRGSCCEQGRSVLEPLIVPLDELALGDSATIAFIHSTRHEYLQRVSALGVAPGRSIRLRQRQPALVVQLGETELALDHRAGQEIFVKRHVRSTLPSHVTARSPWWWWQAWHRPRGEARMRLSDSAHRPHRSTITDKHHRPARPRSVGWHPREDGGS